MTLTPSPSTCSPSFPYGTIPVDPELLSCYRRDYSDADNYPLPARLPVHHPILTRLEGTYPLAYTVPPWWPACVAQVQPAVLRPVLDALSPQEFRSGCLEHGRWKAFRERFSPDERRLLPSSPRLTTLLEHSPWQFSFQDRGPTDTPDQLSLVISTRPLDFLYMSNGRDWRSCQHYQDGSENHRVPGNFYDTGVALAMILVPGTSSADAQAVLVRTTLRVLFIDHMPLVVIGRIYHNHATLAVLLLARLAGLLDAQEIPWGFLDHVNSLDLCWYKHLGEGLPSRLESARLAHAARYWLPRDWHAPYVDGVHSWDTVWEDPAADYQCMQLEASVCLLRPRPGTVAPAPLRHRLARLSAVDLCAPLV